MSLHRPSPPAWLRIPTGKLVVRYALVSVVSVIVSQAVLFVTFGALRLWSAVVCNIVACAVATLPSYYLNRRWAWGRSGPSHMWKEVVPFWVLAFIGLGVSIWAVDLADRYGPRLTSSHLGVSLIVNAASLAAFGIVWVCKFVVFNELMFVDRSAKRAARAARKGGSPTETASGAGERPPVAAVEAAVESGPATGFAPAPPPPEASPARASAVDARR